MEVQSGLPVALIFVPLALGVVIFVSGPYCGRLREAIAVLGTSAALLIAGGMAREVAAGYTLVAWQRTLYVDGLGALMALVGSAMTLVIAVYSIRYIGEQLATRQNPEKWATLYFGLLLVFVGVMMWACAANNIVMLYVAIEATGLATVLLVTFHWQRQALEAGFKYLLLVTVGLTLALLGCVLLYSAAGSLPRFPRHHLLLVSELGRVAGDIRPGTAFLAMALFIAGFGTKAGLIPFHAWLPDAHAEAPAPISALLSGVVIKIGAFALARTLTIFTPHYPAAAVFVAGLTCASMLIGIVVAFVQDDIKRLLAYSSVSQIAYVIQGIGLGTYMGIYGGLYHLVNHTVAKALLFLCAGAVMHATGGLRRISKMGGLGASMPVTAACFFVGALALGGLPPLNGFMSKLTLYLAAADRQLLWAAIIAAATGVLTLACMVLAGVRMFWGRPRSAAANSANPAPGPEVREVPPAMYACMLLLAALCVALGVFPNAIHPLLDHGVRSILRIGAGG